jgi:hypothetical protein
MRYRYGSPLLEPFAHNHWLGLNSSTPRNSQLSELKGWTLGPFFYETPRHESQRRFDSFSASHNLKLHDLSCWAFVILSYENLKHEKSTGCWIHPSWWVSTCQPCDPHLMDVPCVHPRPWALALHDFYSWKWFLPTSKPLIHDIEKVLIQRSSYDLDPTAISAPRYSELHEIHSLVYPLQTLEPQIHEIIQHVNWNKINGSHWLFNLGWWASLTSKNPATL